MREIVIRVVIAKEPLGYLGKRSVVSLVSQREGAPGLGAPLHSASDTADYIMLFDLENLPAVDACPLVKQILQLAGGAPLDRDKPTAATYGADGRPGKLCENFRRRFQITFDVRSHARQKPHIRVAAQYPAPPRRYRSQRSCAAASPLLAGTCQYRRTGRGPVPQAGTPA